MLAEFSTIPVLKKDEGFSKYVAEALDIIAASGLDYELTAMATIVEGPADEIFALIRKVHDAMFEHSDRVLTNIRIDDRRDASGRLKGKVKAVREKMKSS